MHGSTAADMLRHLSVLLIVMGSLTLVACGSDEKGPVAAAPSGPVAEAPSGGTTPAEESSEGSAVAAETAGDSQSFDIGERSGTATYTMIGPPSLVPGEYDYSDGYQLSFTIRASNAIVRPGTVGVPLAASPVVLYLRVSSFLAEDREGHDCSGRPGFCPIGVASGDISGYDNRYLKEGQTRDLIFKNTTVKLDESLDIEEDIILETPDGAQLWPR